MKAVNIFAFINVPNFRAHDKYPSIELISGKKEKVIGHKFFVSLVFVILEESKIQQSEEEQPS
jgi:hypothetical protein